MANSSQRLCAGASLAWLQQQGISCHILSGDHPQAVKSVADRLQLSSWQGHCQPEDKHRRISELQQQDHRVIMMGDGINDAPALAQADVSVAMGQLGSDLARSSADINLMQDSLWQFCELLALSKRTLTLVRLNIALALGIKLLFVLLTLMGLGQLWMAVLADVGASLLVISLGLSLVRWSGLPRPAGLPTLADPRP